MVVGDNFVLVCVGGVTNGGKTSLTTELKLRFPHMKFIKQDDFFLTPDDPRHVWVGNSMFRCQNWEIPESLDFVGLKQKVRAAEYPINPGVRIIWESLSERRSENILEIPIFTSWIFLPGP